MAFIFTCGTHMSRDNASSTAIMRMGLNFARQVPKMRKLLGETCQEMVNYASTFKRTLNIQVDLHSREWFTFCFVPIIPFSLKPWHAVHCHICDFTQDIQYRPDVQQQMNGGGQNIPLQQPPQGSSQGPPQGWGQGQPPPGPGKPQYV